MDKLNNAAGGGAAGEKKEDGLDKGMQASFPPLCCYNCFLEISLFVCVCRTSKSLTLFLLGVDWVQENVFKQGDQSNESAVEQAKDEQISGMSSTAAGRSKTTGAMLTERKMQISSATSTSRPPERTSLLLISELSQNIRRYTAYRSRTFWQYNLFL